MEKSLNYPRAETAAESSLRSIHRMKYDFWKWEALMFIYTNLFYFLYKGQRSIFLLILKNQQL